MLLPKSARETSVVAQHAQVLGPQCRPWLTTKLVTPAPAPRGSNVGGMVQMKQEVVASAALDLDAAHALQEALAALDEAEVDRARELAQAALSLAQTNQDQLLQAKALLCLGHCDRFVSGFRRAHDAYQKAALLFRMLGDPVGEAE